MHGFQWLNELAQYIGKLLPRFKLLPPTEHGVIFTLGGKAKKAGPGFLAWWPLVHILRCIPSTVQSINVSPRIKSNGEADILPIGKVFSMVAQYTIVDPVRCMLVTSDSHAFVENRILAMVDLDAFDLSRKAIACELISSGLELNSLCITHCSLCIPIFNFADTGYADVLSPIPKARSD